MSDLVRLSHYDPRWKQEFEQTRSSILQSCEGWVTDVWHVGSTSIPGIVAQPIIDCIAVVSDLEGWDTAVLCIEGLNFSSQILPQWLTEDEDRSLARPRQLLGKPRYGAKTHRIFLFGPQDPMAEKMIAFRDLLRGFRDEALRFEEQKVAIWKSSGGSPCGYDAAKAQLFRTPQTPE